MIPLVISIAMLVGTISVFLTRVGITRLASNALSFKSRQLEDHVLQQWNLLVENDLHTQQPYIDAFTETIRSYATNTLIEDEGDFIFAFDQNSVLNDSEQEKIELILTTSEKDFLPFELKELNRIIVEQQQNVNVGNFLAENFKIANISRIGHYFILQEMGWIFLVTNKVSNFYRPVYSITVTTIVIAILAVISGVVVILLFSNTLVTPIQRMLASMKRIIKTNTLDERVKIEYNDEIGQLSRTFNIMIAELEKSSAVIKRFAFEAVLAKKNESKVRNIFQKYVPKTVINDLIKDPTQLLKGQSKEIAIVFTDIRNFTTISEKFTPNELVLLLNSYFEALVNAITKYKGIIDKYIGDAIMAFFGAPQELENPAFEALKACNEMRIVIEQYNKQLLEKQLSPFYTGIGLNFGRTTVGNIGSETKMDYTIIGDEVNLGSRLEGLTKKYKTDFIFSNSVKEKLPEDFPVRAVDLVQVKGRSKGERIYTTDPEPTEKRQELFTIHNRGFESYLAGDFKNALQHFQSVQAMDAEDQLSKIFINRTQKFIETPPPEWNGIYVMRSK